MGLWPLLLLSDQMIALPQALLGRFVLSLILTWDGAPYTTSVSVRQPEIDFGKVVRGAVLEHTFTVVNGTDVAVQIDKVRLTPPLLPSQVPSVIPAHAEAVLRVKLDTRTLDGPFDGVVLLSFSDPKVADLRLTVSGQVVLPVEVAPPAIFATVERGEKKEVAVDIVNHEGEPVMIGAPRYSPGRFTTRLETLEEGRRFRLTLVLNPDGSGGRSKDIITLKTSSAAVPELRIAAHTYLRDRVYTYPDAVDLGALRLEEIRRSPELLKSTAQTLMVYRKERPDFQAKVSTDVPGVNVTAERGPLGDRYQVTVTLDPNAIRLGKISGSIVIDTNDPEYPKLTVPVTGEILK